ncbi:hypothetical protein IJ674_02400 [bacterium]|jgi:hypothetical protein|nr:hypothetical protein [bacterium]
MKIDKIDKINPVGNLDLYKVREVITSSKITTDQKIKFIKKNHSEISHLVDEKISSSDFKTIMNNRPLILFKPLKNSYTKAGDKKLLAIALGIKPNEVDNYIKNINLQVRSMQDINTMGISKDNYEEVKTYIFRHGEKEQVINFLDYELSHAKNILHVLYHTLEYNSGGVADYFIRPIHRLDNGTMLGIYNVVDKNLKAGRASGKISDVQAQETAEWALARIYKIQNNQRLQNAIKLKKELE